METNIIHHEDSIKLMKTLPDESINLIFADPPYNLQLKNTLLRPNQSKVAGVDDEWDKFKSFKHYDDFSIEWLKESKRILKNDGTIFVIGSYHNIFRVGNIMMDLGYWILNDIQWYKSNPMPNFRGVRFTNATETIIWAKKSEKSKYVFNYQVMKKLNNGKQMTSVWKIPLCRGVERIKDENGKKAHSTQKPEEILKRIILAGSNEKDIILDPFGGTGTTAAVAKKLNRQYIVIEKEKKYVKIIDDRLNSICPDDFKHLKLSEPIKKILQKVSMQKLIKYKYINPGQKFYAKKGTIMAYVLPNGNIKNNTFEGSIHKMGAYIKETDGCNGWTFWYYKENDNFKLIDNLRIKYREENGI